MPVLAPDLSLKGLSPCDVVCSSIAVSAALLFLEICLLTLRGSAEPHRSLQEEPRFGFVYTGAIPDHSDLRVKRGAELGSTAAKALLHPAVLCNSTERSLCDSTGTVCAAYTPKLTPELHTHRIKASLHLSQCILWRPVLGSSLLSTAAVTQLEDRDTKSSATYHDAMMELRESSTSEAVRRCCGSKTSSFRIKHTVFSETRPSLGRKCVVRSGLR